MHRRDAGAQRQREQQRRDVAPPDDPGRVRAQRVMVEQVDEVDGQLPAPRRDDGAHRLVADERVELIGPCTRGAARDAVTDQALAEDHLETAATQPVSDESQPCLVFGSNRRRRGGHRNRVTGTQRAGVANLGRHAVILAFDREQAHANLLRPRCAPPSAGVVLPARHCATRGWRVTHR